jgi:hypothetical protein
MMLFIWRRLLARCAEAGKVQKTRLLQTAHSLHIFVILKLLVLYDAVNRKQSFNTLTPFYFISHSLHVSARTGHLQVRYTIRYFKDYFNTTDPLHVRNLM